jgi:hypothetical protein
MKRVFVFFGMLALASAACAQQVFLEAHAATNFESVAPSIGGGVGLGPLDILAGASFSFSTDKFEYGSLYTDSNYAEKAHSVGIYAGAAPYAPVGEKLRLSFPLLLQIRFGGTSGKDYVNPFLLVNRHDLEHSSRFGIDFLAGARASYLLSAQWSLFTGFLFTLFEYTQYKNTYYDTDDQNGRTYARIENFIGFFRNGKVQFGVRFTF